MNAPYRELALQFGNAAGDRLVGVISSPTARSSASLGILIVVGGPQYRVGSHRQFVLLSRALAAHGLAVMRFDCSGMGDSTGDERSFTERQDDIRAASAAFRAAVPSIDSIAILGLCDAASASLMYVPRAADVTRLILLNPWVRTDAGIARTHIRHYYASRIVSRDFWKALVHRKVPVGRAVAGFVTTFIRSRRAASAPKAAESFPIEMARGWKKFGGQILLICAGDDLTAREFLDHAAADGEWRGLLDDPRVTVRHHADADHTFSRGVWRDQLVQWILDWLGQPETDRRPEDARARLFART